MANDGAHISYTGTQKLLHWAVALCVLIIVFVSLVMDDVERGTLRDLLHNLHYSLSALMFVLMVVRLAIRLNHGVPPPEPGTIEWQCKLSHAVHMTLYPALLIQPLIGWAATSAYGAQVPIFGLFQLPAMLSEDRALSKVLFGVHSWLGYAIFALAALHIVAAFYHHLVLKDGVLRRML